MVPTRKLRLHTVMTLFDMLLVTHFVGDWLLQTEWQARNKAHNWRAMFYHVAMYHALILGVLIAWFGFGNFAVYGVTAVLAASHALLDRRWPVQVLMRTLRLAVTHPPEAWLTIMIDQILHVVLLALAVSWLS